MICPRDRMFRITVKNPLKSLPPAAPDPFPSRRSRHRYGYAASPEGDRSRAADSKTHVPHAAFRTNRDQTAQYGAFDAIPRRRLIVDANPLRYTFRSGRRLEQRRRPQRQGGRHADLQGTRWGRDVPFERCVPHRSLQQPAGFCRRHARSRRGGARRGGKVQRGRAHASQPRRRQGRLQTPRGRRRHHADGLQGRLQAAHRRWLDRRLGAGRIRRPRPADGAHAIHQRISLLVEHGLCDVSGPHAGRGRGDLRPRHPGTESDLPAQAHQRSNGPAR